MEAIKIWRILSNAPLDHPDDWSAGVKMSLDNEPRGSVTQYILIQSPVPGGGS